MFVDLDLWEKVTEDAEVVFNLPAGSLNVPFSNGLIQYADLDGTHGGYNFFMQESTARLNEMIRFLDDNVKAHLSVAEYDNLLSLTALSHQATTEYSDMQDFYYDALADTTFSEEYQEILTFGLNDINFKKYLDNNQDDFNICYTDIWGGSADIAVYSSSYHTNQIHCRGCCPGVAIPQTISHAQHVSMSQGLSAHASAEAGFWCGILHKLSKIGDLL